MHKPSEKEWLVWEQRMQCRLTLEPKRRKVKQRCDSSLVRLQRLTRNEEMQDPETFTILAWYRSSVEQ